MKSLVTANNCFTENENLRYEKPRIIKIVAVKNRFRELTFSFKNLLSREYFCKNRISLDYYLLTYYL